eukprot:GEMP01005403.1.p1 GENE.GEMP01005403.1~~GEMP01005403.1.p1  ORF type:complete len:416 (+),score=98.70 GEMP01005403.1:212-1459(+)
MPSHSTSSAMIVDSCPPAEAAFTYFESSSSDFPSSHIMTFHANLMMALNSTSSSTPHTAAFTRHAVELHTADASSPPHLRHPCASPSSIHPISRAPQAISSQERQSLITYSSSAASSVSYDDTIGERLADHLTSFTWPMAMHSDADTVDECTSRVTSCPWPVTMETDNDAMLGSDGAGSESTDNEPPSVMPMAMDTADDSTVDSDYMDRATSAALRMMMDADDENPDDGQPMDRRTSFTLPMAMDTDDDSIIDNDSTVSDDVGDTRGDTQPLDDRTSSAPPIAASAMVASSIGTDSDDDMDSQANDQENNHGTTAAAFIVADSDSDGEALNAWPPNHLPAAHEPPTVAQPTPDGITTPLHELRLLPSWVVWCPNPRCRHGFFMPLHVRLPASCYSCHQCPFDDEQMHHNNKDRVI